MTPAPDSSIRLDFSEIDTARAGLGSEHRADFQRGTFVRPEWYDATLEPDSEAYRAQQLRLWQQISGRESYDQLTDEMTPEVAGTDAISRPAFYQPGDSELAGEHLIALGHLVYRSGVREGDTALEYGAGYGQIAVALARLGVSVHTVDISRDFCAIVERVAEHYGVDLTAHQETFGFAPQGLQFDLIYFYESFHHCLEFHELIPRLRELLAPDGRLILAGEPIVPDASLIVPFPWGIRLDVENVVVVRDRGWMELGFQESFLMQQFVAAGFVWEHHPCPPARQAALWVLRHRPESMWLATHTLTTAEASTWHAAEPTGRWTRHRSVLYVDESVDEVEVSMVNYHPVARTVWLRSAGSVTCLIEAGQRNVVQVPQADGELTIECEPLIPSHYEGAVADDRALGIFVESVSY